MQVVGEKQLSNEEERNQIDYVITIGGDGTILALLRNLQEYEKTKYLPPIITFSQVPLI
jgi:NAD kinase